MPKKLIEVALPLEAINAESAREKSIRHGHPSALHLWWARRPLAAARAVIWSSLVDDPSEHPEMFPTEEEQAKERERLFQILSDLVVWENSNNESLLAKARSEIMKYTHGEPPALLDPFAGGGAIPLEAQRLGLEAHAHDLNPVAVMINKAMIEIPAKFSGQPPVNPETRKLLDAHGTWKGAGGLAEDVRYYGQWMKDQAFQRIGHLYPKVRIPADQGGGEATVIAWIWARTVRCPNPACCCEMPLASKFVLSKKKNRETWIEPIYDGTKFVFRIHKGKCPKNRETLKLGRGAVFKCPCCGEVTKDDYVKELGKEGKLGATLMAVIAEGGKGRLYLEPTEEQEQLANVPRPANLPEGAMPNNPRWFSPPAFGMSEFNSVFTNRQLLALTTFSDLIPQVRRVILEDALKQGMDDNCVGLADGGIGATAYAEAVSVYLAFVIDQLSNHCSTLCGWHANNEQLMNTYGRQALPMVWDYAEVNVFSNSTGSYANLISRQIEGLSTLGYLPAGVVKQRDAQSDCGLRNIMVSTDPPYYDNIGYADLSDYFYIWLRRSLKDIYPELFRTMLVPKSEELVATPYRFANGISEAKAFFETGMYHACCNLYKYAKSEYPATIFYAYKQSESVTTENEAVSNSGWETMLSSIINAGFSITGTWPVRTEQTAALKTNINALASSIVLVCRKRDENARTCTRRDFVTTLKRELKPALQKLQQSNIAPVDLAQSAIGPGIGVFSRYKKVLESDGSPMTVRSALQIINQELDLYFSGQDSSIDSDSRLCVELFTQYAFNTVKFGDADILARAKGTSVAKLAGQDILYAAKGDVRLLTREELPEKIKTGEHNIWLLTQQLTHAMETGGIQKCAEIIAPMFGNNAEDAKNLAYRLYSICERKNWAQEAYAYNALVVAWPEIQSKAAEIKAIEPVQLGLFE